MGKDRNKQVMKRFGDFLAGKGFYIALFLCVAAIGISGYFLLTETKRAAETVGQAELVVTPQPTAVPSQVPSTPAPTPTPTPTPAATPTATAPALATASPKETASPTPTPTPTPAPAPSPTPAPTPAAVVFTWPLRGEVLADFSLEALAYDETMGDWRTHTGLDIGGALGAQVVAAADGTVTAVYADPLMGTTVVIDHGEGHTSRYSNLAAKPPVSEGDRVTTGMVIGSVGTTAPAESRRAAHLHFEMTEEGRTVDPVGLLPGMY